MNEKVNEFIEKRKSELNKKEQEAKKGLLISLGLFDVVGKHANGYYVEEKVPIDVTDEEYAEILKYADFEPEPQKNTISMVLKIIAWVTYLAGFIMGLVMADSSSVISDTASIVSLLTWWSVAGIAGTMILGFAEIISLLHNLLNK